MKKNLLSALIIIAGILISYYTAGYFGSIYDKAFPAELNSGWIGSSASLQFVRGISLSLIFFITIVTYGWVFKSWSSTLWFISPLLLWEGTMDLRHFYIPIGLVVLAFGLAKLIRIVTKKFNNPSSLSVAE